MFGHLYGRVSIVWHVQAFVLSRYPSLLCCFSSRPGIIDIAAVPLIRNAMNVGGGGRLSLPFDAPQGLLSQTASRAAQQAQALSSYNQRLQQVAALRQQDANQHQQAANRHQQAVNRLLQSVNQFQQQSINEQKAADDIANAQQQQQQQSPQKATPATSGATGAAGAQQQVSRHGVRDSNVNRENRFPNNQANVPFLSPLTPHVLFQDPNVRLYNALAQRQMFGRHNYAQAPAGFQMPQASMVPASQESDQGNTIGRLDEASQPAAAASSSSSARGSGSSAGTMADASDLAAVLDQGKSDTNGDKENDKAKGGTRSRGSSAAGLLEVSIVCVCFIFLNYVPCHRSRDVDLLGRKQNYFSSQCL